MRKVIKYVDKPLFLITVILFIAGLIMVFSSSNVTAYMSHAVSPYNYFLKQAVFLGSGLILFLIMINFNTKFYGIVSWLGIIVLGAILISLLIIGQVHNQAKSWFDFGFFSVQPSEFIKVIFIIWMARYYEVNEKKLNSYWYSLFPIAVAGVITFLILLQPDLGTAIIFMIIVGCMFLASTVPRKIKFNTISAGIVMAVLLVVFALFSGMNLLQTRQLERFNFTRPCDRLFSTGSQVCNGYIAMNNGGLRGVGLGNSTQKYLYLPEPYTDFIFAVIVEEVGLVGGIALLIAYFLTLTKILIIGKNSYTDRGALICYGVAIYIFCHIAVNLMGLFGLMPMTGVPLPFMSYGGSFTWCLIIALTFVQRVSVETGIRGEAKKKRKSKSK